MAGTLPSPRRGSASDRHHGHRGAHARRNDDHGDVGRAQGGHQWAGPRHAVRSGADQLRGRGRGEGFRRRGALRPSRGAQDGPRRRAVAGRGPRGLGERRLAGRRSRAWRCRVRHGRGRHADRHRAGRDPGRARPTALSPHFLPNFLVDTPTSYIATDLGLRGPNFAVVSACATGAHAIGVAGEMLRRGEADVILAGGADCGVIEVLLAGFTVMKALGKPRPGEPVSTASRPFDVTRDGFVIGEGAVCWCSSGWPTRSSAAPSRSPSWSATGRRTTRTTSPRRIPRASA